MADRVLEKMVQHDQSDRYRSCHTGASCGQLSVEAQWVFTQSCSVNTQVAAHVSRTCTQGILFFRFLKGQHLLNSAFKMFLVFCRKIDNTETTFSI